MNFPLISEYVEAVKMAEDNFDQLCHLRPVLDKDGQPVMSSGNFAVVFKMEDTESGKFHAVRCFHREQEGRTESYRQIEEALRQVQSPYLVSFRYMDKELFVDSRQTGGEMEFPVLLMDWVEGVTLDRYIREHINDKDALEVLAYRFSLMASWLIAQPFAHGDLKPDNILVRPDGTITLVDYDGMFVPSMQGQSARELGSPDFRHPLRKEADFDGSIDDFPLVSILLSLKAIAVNPSLLDQFGASDRLLFSEADYRDISRCRVLHEIFPSSDNELNKVISLFTLALTERKFVDVAPSLLELSEPTCLADEELSTEVTDEDLAEAVEDEFGVKYSKDGKRLLKGVTYIEEYAVREGTKVICDFAFCWYWNVGLNIRHHYDHPYDDNVVKMSNGEVVTEDYAAYCMDQYYKKDLSFMRRNAEMFSEYTKSYVTLKSIYIPNSVTKIGDSAFEGCYKLSRINIPIYIKKIARGVFYECYSLEDICIPYNVTEIEEYAFSLCWDLKNCHVPNNVTKIGKGVFSRCDSLTSIDIPDSVTEIEDSTFDGCSALANIKLSTGVTKIGEYAFSWCESLTSINIPNSVTEIGKGAFRYCNSLTSINIPDSVTEIEDSTFVGCSALANIKLSTGVTKIGKRAFWDCNSLTSIDIPDSVTEIEDSTFEGCSALANIKLSTGVTKIGKGAFSGCDSLTSIDIPDSVTEIEDSTFEGCSALTNIKLSTEVTKIGLCAFRGCSALTNINIPYCVRAIGAGAFEGCHQLGNIIIPSHVEIIGEGTLTWLDDGEVLVG